MVVVSVTSMPIQVMNQTFHERFHSMIDLQHVDVGARRVLLMMHVLSAHQAIGLMWDGATAIVSIPQLNQIFN